MFLASPDGEKALCPCRLPLGEVFWGALPVLVLRVALTHIVNRFLLGAGWGVFGLDTALRVSVPPKALQERPCKSPLLQSSVLI